MEETKTSQSNGDNENKVKESESEERAFGRGPKKKKKSAYRRMIEHRIKVVSIIVGVIALLLVLFFTVFASYDFSEKAWHVKFDPIHGYKYTIYMKQQYTHSRIVISSCSKKSEEVKVPDTIWGVRVEELEEGAFADEVKTIRLGQYIYIVGEGYGSKTLILPSTYGQTENYTSFKDKRGSGFYYKALPDGTLMAFAYFGTEDNYSVPGSFAGIKVSKATEYYVNDDYLTLLAEEEADHSTILPYNMVRVKMVQRDGIDPYVTSLEDLESREKMKVRLMSLPDQYAYGPDGLPADGESAIKLAMTTRGNGVDESCAMVMAKYPPLNFVSAARFLSKRTSDCHTEGEPDFEDWLWAGMVEVG
ncbi:MAG: hypothetical protein J5379_08365 [Clostridiales bacterium]|nr:hypothetical protein [Clostridiales bacterium]